ncbi:hypothetical protein IMCC3317_30860 [Kordia antarctica]|uniref:YGGT family protein n=1 Tax=Kordia antarctica TaxID=1218801 RepID=A0A7L4ZM89_9FLAO|nr:hypothetical protein IMCC3317_30860 [Kordia antarctica]
MILLKLFACFLIVSLFIFSKLQAYETRISPKYKTYFGMMTSILKPILNVFSKFFKPHKVGNGLALDTTQFVLLILLLLILMI